MKRTRDEVMPALTLEKGNLREEYSVFLGSNRTDKAALLGPQNRNRYKNALFELSFYLNINHTQREASWLCVEKLAQANTQDAHLTIPVLFIHVVACIWLSQNRHGPNPNAFRVSFFLNSLSKVTSTITVRGHSVYQPDFFLSFTDEFIKTLVLLQADPVILERAQMMSQSYRDHVSLFAVFTRVFEIIFKFDFQQSSTEPLSQATASPLLDIFRYTWLFLLYTQGNLVEQFATAPGRISMTVWCVVFVASQTSHDFQRTVQQVLSQAALQGLPAVDPGSICDRKISVVWTYQYTSIMQAFCHWFQLDPSFHYQNVLPFNSLLQATKHRGLLKSEMDEQNGDFPWKLYRQALDHSATGLLQTNMQNLVSQFDTWAKKSCVEIDLLGFVPTWDRSMATPVHFARTPGKSVVSKSCARNVLRTSVSQGSGIHKAMTATPWSASGMVGSKSLSYCTLSLSEALAKLVEGKNPQRDAFKASLSREIHSRVRKCIASKGSESSKNYWELASSIYYDLLYKIMAKSSLANPTNFSQIQNDSQFNRTLICISLEMVRFASGTKSIDLTSLIKITNINFVDLALMIKLATVYFVKAPLWPREVVKRLIGVHERLLESDVWTDSSLYGFLKLGDATEAEIGRTGLAYADMFAIPAVVKFYGQLHTRLDSTLAMHATQFQNLDRSKFMGYLHLYEHILALAQTRLNGFCASEVLDLSASCQSKAAEIIVQCLKNEYRIKLLSNRHLDVLIICSVYMASRLDSKNQSILFKELIDIYTSYPQYLPSVQSTL
ncbi:Retinoblastoma-like protein 1 [Kappamyces sp. JEL0680]|nr:Retinoblastoma-like protein 1 [Kappamyces sp. JEL0680]